MSVALSVSVNVKYDSQAWLCGFLGYRHQRNSWKGRKDGSGVGVLGGWAAVWPIHIAGTLQTSLTLLFSKSSADDLVTHQNSMASHLL